MTVPGGIVGNGGDPSKLLKTGQTIDRTPVGRTSKDDGAEQKGQSNSYDVKTAGQYSGTTNITVNAKIDIHINAVVLDRVTGLMWSRTVAASIGPGSNGLLAWDDTGGNDEDIFEYCDQANLALLSGHSNWRIPNISELMSIAEFEAPNAFPDPIAFPSWVTFIWSSTTQSPDISKGLAMAYGNGLVQAFTKTTSFRNITLVRLGVN